MFFPAGSLQALLPLNAILAYLCKESSTLQKIRKAFKRAVDFMLFKNLKIPVQCPGSRIKPSVSVGSTSARETFRTGATTFRHLAGAGLGGNKSLISWELSEMGPH